MRYIFTLLLLLLVVPIYANRDIVYSARYYLPPGSRGTSHFHLYRINPDGTGRTQLTYGSLDDTDPKWSPDGKHIAFERIYRQDGQARLCIISPQGGSLKTLLNMGDDSDNADIISWSPDGKTIAVSANYQTGSGARFFNTCKRTEYTLENAGCLTWSPDGQDVFVTVFKSQNNSYGEVYDLKTGARRIFKGVDTNDAIGSAVVWASKNHLLGMVKPSNPNHVEFCMYDLNGGVIRRILGRLPKDMSQQFTIDPVANGCLLPRLGLRVPIVYAADTSISNWQDYDNLLLDPSTGKLKPLADGQFLVFCPDASRFLVSPHRSLVNYGRGKNGYIRYVWATPLQVGNVSYGHIRTITPGLVRVEGADWRQRKL